MLWKSGANAKLSLPLLGVSLTAPEARLYNIKCQSVSTLSLRSKTRLGFHIKVLSIRVVGIIRSVRTLDPSLPACYEPLVPVGLSASTSVLVSTFPPFLCGDSAQDFGFLLSFFQSPNPESRNGT